MTLTKLITTSGLLLLITSTFVSSKERLKRSIGDLKPPIVYLNPILKKQYKVPGSAIIGTAKRHGYYFGVGMNDIPKGCKFQGMHWVIPARTSCEIIGFKSLINKCKILRKGWTIKKIEFNNFDLSNQQTNSYDLPSGNYPLIQLWPNNQGRKSKMKSVSIKYLTLEGPAVGQFNKYEEAFSHCSDPSYRP